MKKFVDQKRFLPSFPRTPLVPYNPNAMDDDIIARDSDAVILLDPNSRVNCEEKIDGANVGMVLVDDQPIIRNRDHILRKGYAKNTPAKKQFSSIWTWFYANKDKFVSLQEKGPYSVYGEWMVAQHGIFYDSLPDWFIAYDVYNYETGQFVQNRKARSILIDCGFSYPRLLRDCEGPLESLESLSQWDNTKAEFSTHEYIEGVYLKIWNEDVITHRFKWVREDYKRGQYWDGKIMKKNEVRKNDSRCRTEKSN